MVIVLIVYADILVFLNTLVDYFLLLAAGHLIGRKPKTIRIVLASVLGGFSSLYIFLPKQALGVELLYKTVSTFLMTVICFKIDNVKQLLKAVVVLCVVSCAYGGVMYLLWSVFKPYGMVINNSVVYLDISPMVLVICSVLGYLIFTIGYRVFSVGSKLAERCSVTIFANDKSVTLNAIADTGNSLKDVFGKSEVIITRRPKLQELFGTDFELQDNMKSRYRILPCSTVSGFGSLEAYRCDKAVLQTENKQIVLQKPLVAISKTDLNDDYNAIINPEILR
jgi:stage II sporulation protein GA (sporulation sigma-E factor processing peptidase)